MARKTNHCPSPNPERRAFRGRSHKTGLRVRNARAAQAAREALREAEEVR